MSPLEKYISKYKKDSFQNINLLLENNNKAIVLHAKDTDIFLDISKNTLSFSAYNELFSLAKENNLKEKIRDLVDGKKINRTEHRAANHMVLRCLKYRHTDESGRDISKDIFSAFKKMESLCWKIDSHLWKGFSNKPIKNIVSIGIGGSHLGPNMAAKALKPYWKNNIKCHYLSNIDGSNFTETLRDLDPDTTLFIVLSKSFSTEETLKNADACKSWFLQNGGQKRDLRRHFFAVTARIEKAINYGIDSDNIFPVWDWVGGRYSLWSAMGLPLCLTIGFENFKALLEGAWCMDQHFIHTDFKNNLPVNLALLGIYYRNILDAQAYVVLPYDHYLQTFPAHLQQLDMESNGKSVTLEGNMLNYNSGPIIWGGVGSNGQHAYHQWLHQGTSICPCDFILPLKSHNPVESFHSVLVANCLSQSEALLEGRSEEAAFNLLLEKGHSREDAKILAPHHCIPGNRPSNTIYFEKLTPRALGSLIALYEHKVFVQGIIWNINSFDQWGVELGKNLSKTVLNAMENKDISNLDGSTAYLVTQFVDAQNRA